MAKAGVVRPSTVMGSDEMSTLYTFLTDICPWYFNMQRWIDGVGPERVEKSRKKQEVLLEKYLEHWGYPATNTKDDSSI